MTNEEAIEELKSRKLTMSMCIDIESCRSANNAIDIAINSIQENTELKAEIEQLKWKLSSTEQLKEDSKIIAKELVKQIREIAQLKSELERYKKLIPKMCENCEYEDLLCHEEPCEHCDCYSKWKLKFGGI